MFAQLAISFIYISVILDHFEYLCQSSLFFYILRIFGIQLVYLYGSICAVLTTTALNRILERSEHGASCFAMLGCLLSGSVGTGTRALERMTK